MRGDYLFIDIETLDFPVESGIYEVAVLAIQNGKIVDTLHIYKIVDEEEYKRGKGRGLEDISADKASISEFKKFMSKYPYDFVAYNASFDRKFLVHYGWVSKYTEFIDVLRSVRITYPNMFSHRLSYVENVLLGENNLTHTALDDVTVLYKLVKEVKISITQPKSKLKERNKLEFLEIESEKDISEILKDQKVVFTGVSQYKRSDMENLAKEAGATVLKSVSKNTTLLVVGVGGGSKIKKAEELGIDIQSDVWFMGLLNGDKVSDESLNLTEYNSKYYNGVKSDDTIQTYNTTNLKIDKHVIVEDVDNKEAIEKLRRDFLNERVSIIYTNEPTIRKITTFLKKIGVNKVDTTKYKDSTIIITTKYYKSISEHCRKNNKIYIPLYKLNKYLIDNNIHIN